MRTRTGGGWTEGSEAVDRSFPERLRRRWFPVCRGADAVPRHVVHTALLGQELAVWRADDGTVNAWENRCPHRGVRLSIGTNLGHALKCRYHGWTYESGSARCIAIPCHPRLTPAAAIRVRAYPCMDRQGHVWVRLAEEGDGDGGMEDGARGGNEAGRTDEPSGERGAGTPGGASDVVISPAHAEGRAESDPTLRSIYVDAPAAAVSAAFAHYGDAAAEPVQVEAAGLWTVHVLGGRDGDLLFMLQPLSERATVIHGVLADRTSRVVPVSEPVAVSAPASAGALAEARDRLAVLRRHNAALGVVRDAAERQVSP